LLSSDPRRALRAVAGFQRVLIEKTGAGEREAGDGGVVADQIAVVLVGGDDAIEHALDALAQGRIINLPEAVAGPFERLVDIGIEGAMTGDFGLRFLGGGSVCRPGIPLELAEITQGER
jgi:hypothetical protein